MPHGPREQSPGINLPSLRPQASPVDAFSPRDRSSELSRLAESLSRFSPTLARFSQQAQEKENQENIQEGAEFFRQANKSFQELVDSGEITNDMNPFFRLGAMEQAGRATAQMAAAEFRVRMREGLETGDISSLEDFEALLEENTQEAIEDSFGDDAPGALMGAFRTQYENLVNGMRQEAANVLGQQAVTKNFEDLYITVHAGIENWLAAGLSTEEIEENLTMEWHRQTAVSGLGRNATRVNRTMLTAGIDAALKLARSDSQEDRRKAVEVLALISEAKVGNRRLGDDPDSQDAINQAFGQIETLDQAAARREDREREDRADDVINAAFLDVAENGGDADLTVYRDELIRIGLPNGSIDRRLDILRQVHAKVESQNFTRFVDPEFVEDRVGEIWQNPENSVEMQDVLLNDLLADRLDFQSFVALTNQLQQAGALGGPDEDAWTTAYDQVARDTRRGFGGENDFLDEVAEERLRRGMIEFNRQWYDWRSSNPDAGYREQQAVLSEISNSVLERFRSADSVTNVREAEGEDLSTLPPSIPLAAVNPDQPAAWWYSPERLERNEYWEFNDLMVDMQTSSALGEAPPTPSERMASVFERYNLRTLNQIRAFFQAQRIGRGNPTEEDRPSVPTAPIFENEPTLRNPGDR